MKISKRLRVISDFIPDNSLFLDIGCDHALLDIYAVKNKKEVRAIASDINEGPVKSAKDNVKKYNLEQRIKVVKKDGLNSYEKGVDIVILSGLGSHTIVNILKERKDLLKDIETIIISSNNDYYYLRKNIMKLGYYINRHEETLTNTSISFITINSFRDIYKLPFTYLFSMIMPINLFGKIDSWYAIVSNINIIMCPISVGAFLEIFKRKYDKAVYWGCMILYLVSIIASINIFRHYYSLIPITLMNYSSFRQKVDDKNYILYLSLTFGFIALLLMFYGFRG